MWQLFNSLWRRRQSQLWLESTASLELQNSQQIRNPIWSLLQEGLTHIWNLTAYGKIKPCLTLFTADRLVKSPIGAGRAVSAELRLIGLVKYPILLLVIRATVEPFLSWMPSVPVDMEAYRAITRFGHAVFLGQSVTVFSAILQSSLFIH